MESHTHELLMFHIDNIGLQAFCGNKLVLKFMWKHKECRTARTTVKKNRGIPQQGFKNRYKATVMMTWNWKATDRAT